MALGVVGRPGALTELPNLDLHGSVLRFNTGSSAAINVPISAATDRADSLTVVNKHSQVIRVTVNYAAGVNPGFSSSNRSFLVDINGAHDVAFDAGNPIQSLDVDVPDLSVVVPGTAVSNSTLPAINPDSNGYVYITFGEK